MYIPYSLYTIIFIKHPQVNKNKIVTYDCLVCGIRLHKTEIHNIFLMVGVKSLEYSGDVITPTMNLTTSKLLFNSIMLTENANFSPHTSKVLFECDKLVV